MTIRSIFTAGLSGLLAAAFQLFPSLSGAQASLHDPRDPQAYIGVMHQKQAATKLPLLSTVRYTTRQDTLSAYDSTWITYEAGGQRVKELQTFRWAPYQWIPFDRYTYHYNSKGYNDQTTYEYWNIGKADYTPLVRYNYSHDGSGNRTSLFYEVWNNAAGMYKNGLMEHYTLDGSGNKTAILQETWVPGTASWLNSTRETMAYNAQGKQESYMIESWHSVLSIWMMKRQTLTRYNTAGVVPVRDEEFEWGGSPASWLPKRRTSNTLSASRISQRVTERYDVPTSNWVSVSKEALAYRATGELTTSLLGQWNAAAGSFDDVSRDTYTYTAEDQPKRVLTLMMVHGKWDVATGAGETIYYYLDKRTPPLGVRQQPAAGIDLVLAPIPARSVLTLRITGAAAGTYSASITDLSGRTLLTKQVSPVAGAAADLDVSALPSGGYTLSIRGQDGQVATRLFSVVR